MSKVIGIDISKQTFDVAFLEKNENWKHLVFENNIKGFKKFLKIITEESVVVMEASGPYYLQFADFLYEKGISVCVLNPLIIRRYSQMKMLRSKTDKKDAQTIANYGMDQKLTNWKPDEQSILKMRQITTLIESYQKQKTQFNNQLGAFISSGILDSQVKKSLNKMIKEINNQINKLESELVDIANENYKETMELLMSIPAIGLKTAIVLIVISNNFKKFECYKQLIAYVGFSPRIYQSGTSVKGKGHICKMGNSRVRKMLYMCTWSAKKVNKSAIEMYERLKEKGKPERVIKVAIANKLIKQAFGIVKSGIKYDENYSCSKFSMA